MVGSHENTTHVDEGALKWLEDIRPGFSFLDVGCGPMGMVDLALNMDHDAYGIDADFNLLQTVDNPQRLILTDFRYTHIVLPINFDVIWSVEVGEHIPEDCVDHYLRTLCGHTEREGLLIFTAARGANTGSHVNCQPPEYWIEKIEKYRFAFYETLTRDLKEHSTMKREFIQNNGLVFKSTL